MTTVAILDYGVGNLASVRNALSHLGIGSETISRADEVAACGRLLLPGVGAFGPASRILRESGLADAIVEHARVRQRPLLGVCLGMQLLMDVGHEDGEHRGLGLLPGSVESLADIAGGLVVPHVGWNEVVPAGPSRIFDGGEGKPCFYFVHGYYCRLDDPSTAVGITHYGGSFPAVVERDNVFGCQFHPEKSQRHGLAILERFGRL
jgi:imidazole glycerol-phosphate synthase subunit HisH